MLNAFSIRAALFLLPTLVFHDILKQLPREGNLILFEITSSTRITDSTASLIDLIICSAKSVKSSVLPYYKKLRKYITSAIKAERKSYLNNKFG